MRVWKSSGFTLLETVITMGIMTIVGGLLLVIIVNSTGLFSQQSGQVQTGLNINDASSKVRASIKQASSVADKYISSSSTYTSGPQVLVLEVASYDSLNNIIADTYDYFIFFLDQDTLYFKTFPNAASSRKAENQIFSTLVNSLNFQYFDSTSPLVEVTPADATKVKMTLTLKQSTGVSLQTSTATTEANLRNN